MNKPLKIESKNYIKFWGVSKNVVKNENYMGNVNFYRAGQSGALQYHPRKDETLHLFEGEAILWTGDLETKELFPIEFKMGETYYVAPNTIHKFQAITNCVVFEISTPIENDRFNCDEIFKNSIG